MAKLVISVNGVSLREFELDKARVTVGRGPDNDVVLNEPVVSGSHAAIDVDSGVARITDLNSTNGTYVNERLLVEPKTLHHNDVITIGGHDLLFVDESVQDFASTVIMQQSTVMKSDREVALRILGGKRSGTLMPIVKDRTALGKPGEQVAVIIRVDDHYLLQPVAVGGKPIGTKLNGELLDENARQLTIGDTIEIADIKLEFVYQE